MLTLKCLKSGSSGNCYFLENETETLILDCGISIQEIKKGLGFNLKRVVGVLCTHEHADHSKSLDDLEYMGIPILAPFTTDKPVKTRFKRQFGAFDITSFDLPHNGVRNSGFLIKAEGQTILYMTDFEYCPYTFKKQNINHMLIECNYQKKYVRDDLVNYEHKLRGHCELETCKAFVETNRTDDLRSVILCHLGVGADDEQCIREISKVSGCPVYVAEKKRIFKLD